MTKLDAFARLRLIRSDRERLYEALKPSKRKHGQIDEGKRESTKEPGHITKLKLSSTSWQRILGPEPQEHDTRSSSAITTSQQSNAQSSTSTSTQKHVSQSCKPRISQNPRPSIPASRKLTLVTSQIQTVRTSIASLESEEKAADAKVDEIKRAIRMKQSGLMTRVTNLTRKESEFKTLQARLSELDSEMKDLKGEVQNIGVECQEGKKRNDHVEGEAKRVKSELGKEKELEEVLRDMMGDYERETALASAMYSPISSLSSVPSDVSGFELEK